ncbi:MAG: EamA family transporter [Williamsia sp.]|nr:EamA family transporter [Williamsia sp.]
MNTWFFLALLSAFFAALTAIFAKMGIKGVDSDLATAIRTVVILLLAWGIVFFRNKLGGIEQLTRQNWTFLLLSGLATGMSWLCYFRALQAGKVSQVAPVDKLSVALAIILSVVFLGETISWKTGMGAALILLGTLVIAWQ